MRLTENGDLCPHFLREAGGTASVGSLLQDVAQAVAGPVFPGPTSPPIVEHAIQVAAAMESKECIGGNTTGTHAAFPLRRWPLSDGRLLSVVLKDPTGWVVAPHLPDPWGNIRALLVRPIGLHPPHIEGRLEGAVTGSEVLQGLTWQAGHRPRSADADPSAPPLLHVEVHLPVVGQPAPPSHGSARSPCSSARDPEDVKGRSWPSPGAPPPGGAVGGRPEVEGRNPPQGPHPGEVFTERLLLIVPGVGQLEVHIAAHVEGAAISPGVKRRAIRADHLHSPCGREIDGLHKVPPALTVSLTEACLQGATRHTLSKVLNEPARGNDHRNPTLMPSPGAAASVGGQTSAAREETSPHSPGSSVPVGLLDEANSPSHARLMYGSPLGRVDIGMRVDQPTGIPG